MKTIVRWALSALMLLPCVRSWAEDYEGYARIEVGMLSTTHILFTTDLTYIDISIPKAVAAAIVPASKNMLALKAKTEFDYETTISALEANGTMHTFVVVYRAKPSTLIVDTRPKPAEDPSGGSAVNTQVRPQQGGAAKAPRPDAASGGSAEAVAAATPGSVNVTSAGSSNFGRKDAPTLEEVVKKPRELFHLGARSYGMELYVSNIYAYSDLTYIVLTVVNRSDIGFEAGDAQFTVEGVGRGKKALATDKPVWAKSSYGTLSCPPNSSVTVGYTVPKLTLLDKECLKIYVYEKSANRNLSLTLRDKDVNYASSPI